MDEKRRHPRFEFDGAALVLIENTPDGPVFILSNYRDISQGGASVIAPVSEPGGRTALEPGDHVRLMVGENERGREAVIVQLDAGRLRLRLIGADELTEFDLARLLETISPGETG